MAYFNSSISGCEPLLHVETQIAGPTLLSDAADSFPKQGGERDHKNSYVM